MKKIVTLALALMMVFAFASCAPSAGPSEESASTEAVEQPSAEQSASESSVEPTQSETKDGFTFGAVMMSLNAPIWVELMKYGDECAKEYNSKVIWKSAEGSLENQIALIEGFIEQKVDCIMIDPFDAVSVIPVIKEALNAGIPFITMGNLVEGVVDDELYNVCTTYPDVRDTSALTDLLIAAGGTDKTYICVSGLTGNFVSDTREKAFIDTCKAAGVENIATPGKWDPSVNLKVTQDMVAAAGDKLGGMYNLDDSMCIISMQATPKGLPVCGHNGEAAAFDKIESGEMMATILIGGAHIGYWNVLTAVKLAQGEKLPHQVYLKTYMVMTQENIDKYWTGKLDAKYPTLQAITPEDARRIAFEPAEMLDKLE